MFSRLKFIPPLFYLYFLFLPIVFSVQTIDYVLLPRFLYTTVFIGVCTLLCLNVLLKTESFSISAPVILLIGFVITSCVGTFFIAHLFSESIFSFLKMTLFIYMFVFTSFCLKQKIITPQQIQTAILLFSLTAIGTAGYDFYRKSAVGQSLFRQIDIVAGGFANKNLLGSALFLCFPLVLYKTRINRFHILLRWLIVSVLLFILIIIRTRSALAAVLFMGLILFGLLIKKKSQKHMLTFVGVISTLAGLFSIFIVKFSGKDKTSYNQLEQYLFRVFDNNTLVTRLNYWRNSWQMYMEHPLLGVGLGNWQVYFNKYGLQNLEGFGIVNGLTTIQRPHNDLLWIITETGTLGFLFYYGFISYILWKLYNKINPSLENNDYWNISILISGICGYLVLSFFDFPLERIEHQVLFMIILALGFYQLNDVTIKKKISIPSYYITIFSILLFSNTIYLIIKRIDSENAMRLVYTYNGNNKEKVIQAGLSAKNPLYQIDFSTTSVDWYLGNAYFVQNDYLKALEHYENAYRQTPYNLLAINNLASCYIKLDQIDKGISLYQKVIRLSPNMEEAIIQLSGVYFNNEQYEKAFETIDKVPTNSKNKSYIPFLTSILQSQIDMITKEYEFETIPEEFYQAEKIVQQYFDARAKRINFKTHFILKVKQL